MRNQADNLVVVARVCNTLSVYSCLRLYVGTVLAHGMILLLNLTARGFCSTNIHLLCSWNLQQIEEAMAVAQK